MQNVVGPAKREPAEIALRSPTSSHSLPRLHPSRSPWRHLLTLPNVYKMLYSSIFYRRLLCKGRYHGSCGAGNDLHNTNRRRRNHADQPSNSFEVKI